MCSTTVDGVDQYCVITNSRLTRWCRLLCNVPTIDFTTSDFNSIFIPALFRAAPTYETASLRKFHSSRTETVRSCTEEVIAFAKSMQKSSKEFVRSFQNCHRSLTEYQLGRKTRSFQSCSPQTQRAHGQCSRLQGLWQTSAGPQATGQRKWLSSIIFFHYFRASWAWALQTWYLVQNWRWRQLCVVDVLYGQYW